MSASVAEMAPSAPAEGASWRAYVAAYDAKFPGLLSTAAGRRILTRLDPKLFALVYLREHLRDKTTGGITLSAFHEDLCEQAKFWVRPSAAPQEDRDAYIAPRDAGKSTWLFLLLPMWAAAHGHRKFAAAFADAAEQAERHLKTFKNELETNDLLRKDYPELCRPARRQRGTTDADTRNMYIAANRFVFGAKGVDSAVLGMKVGSMRPDLIILDDIEPDEANYSIGQKGKRLGTVVDSILPLNVYARVVMVGTVTMPGSIMHDLVKAATDTLAEAPEWVRDENIRPHYYPAIVTDEATGARTSLWPEKWPLQWLLDQSHTRSFRKNMQNDPMAMDGDFWTDEDFRLGPVPGLTAQLLSIDPAVTDKTKSDYTAMAVIGYNISLKKCVVRGAWQVKLQPGAALRSRVLAILAEFPETAGVLIETNQGGDAWRAILGDLGVPIHTKHNSEPKTARAARLLNHYQQGRVNHEVRLAALEEQMVAFPKAAHDDLVDAVGNGVDRFLNPPKKKTAGVKTTSYTD